jgi:hypothetical protein
MICAIPADLCLWPVIASVDRVGLKASIGLVLAGVPFSENSGSISAFLKPDRNLMRSFALPILRIRSTARFAKNNAGLSHSESAP